MSFDANVYAALQASNPDLAAAYLAEAAATATPAPTSTAPPAVFTPPPAAQPQAQPYQAPTAPVAARGTLEDFYNQSSGGGPSVTSKFFNKRLDPNAWLQFSVLADVTNADVQHQKTPQGVLQYFKKNGQDDLTRPKLVLVVKVQVTGSSDGTHTTEFPDGTASVWLKKGPVTDDLIRAMTAAGDPSGFPKAGANMVMQKNGEQASRTVGYNATKLYVFQYAAPSGVVDPTTAATQTAPALPAEPTVSVPSAAPAPALSSTPAPAPAATTGVSAPVAPASITPVPVPNVADKTAALLAELQGAS